MAKNMIIQAWGSKSASKNASKQARAFGYSARAKRSDTGLKRSKKPRGPK